MFTYTAESASPGCNRPREPLSSALIGKKERQPSPAGSPTHPAATAGSALMSWGIRVPGTKTEQRAMSNASASPMQGVSSPNSGFLTPQASTYLLPEKNDAGRPLIALWPATPWTDGTSANRGEGTCPQRGLLTPTHSASWLTSLERPLLMLAQGQALSDCKCGRSQSSPPAGSLMTETP